jgi:hypothetical protein
VAVLVYLCTVIGLSTAFIAGHLLPTRQIARLFEDLHLHRAGDMLKAIEPLDAGQRLEFLTAKAPSRLVPFLLRHRYLALAIAINLPGNFLIGGGGGICLVAGLSRIFSIPALIATLAAAVAPVPLMVLLFGVRVF